MNMGFLLRFTLLALSLLTAISAWADLPGDLTGVHAVLVKCDRRHELSSGPAYMTPCYKGFKYEHSQHFQLVQNGNKVCGNFQSCVGRDCNMILDGETVGLIHGNSVTLYSATGHIENGDAEIARFDISPTGELLTPGSRKRAFTKTSPGMITPENKALCQPEFRPPVRLKDYELDIKGSRPNLTQFAPEDKPAFVAPAPRKVTLPAQKNEINIQDGLRPSGNLIPRTVWINNPTDTPWNITASSSAANSEESNDACAEWLRTSESSTQSYVWAYSMNFPPEQIPPKSIRYTRLCTGDTLNLERSLPECPKFQCLRSCRC